MLNKIMDTRFTIPETKKRGVMGSVYSSWFGRWVRWFYYRRLLYIETFA